jgi:hypothetical protein
VVLICWILQGDLAQRSSGFIFPLLKGTVESRSQVAENTSERLAQAFITFGGP